MVLQEGIDFTEYYRCYCIGREKVHVMEYDPRQPHERRYVADSDPSKSALYGRIVGDSLKLCHALGYDMNTVEFAVRDGIPYAIDYLNPAPDADRHSVGEANFEWILNSMADLAIDIVTGKRKTPEPGTWMSGLAGTL
jgi:hypothetical protein